MESELKQVVNNYQPPGNVQNILADTNVMVIASVTAGGKNTIIQRLLQKGGYQYVVSHTTRSPRENQGVSEENGKNYWFVSVEEMLNMAKNREFIEIKHNYGRDYYGTSIGEFEKVKGSGETALHEIDIQGAYELRKIKSDFPIVFLLPPDHETWIKRMEQRGGVGETDDFRARMTTAEEEIQQAMSDPTITLVVNDDLDQAVAEVDAIAHGNMPSEEQAEKAKKVGWELLNAIKRQLRS